MDVGWRTRVRECECDALGHVNNAVYLCYLAQATADARDKMARGGSVGRPVEDGNPTVQVLPVRPSGDLRRLTMVYRAPALSGDELEVAIWPDGNEEGHPACLYAIRRASDQQLLLQARAVWAGHDLDPFATYWPARGLEHGTRPKPLRLPPDRLGGRPFQWRHTVRRYELGRDGHVRPVEVLRWLEECKFAACVQVGWSVERMAEADFLTVQVRHDTEFLNPLTFGDPVEIVSRLCALRRVQGTWQHQVYRGGELVALDYSTGAFLNRAGQLRPAPPGMMAALLRGDGSIPRLQ